MKHQRDREQLAAALRWAARLDMQEGVDNHFTLAVDLAQATGAPLRELGPELCQAVASQMKTAFPQSAHAYFDYAVRTLRATEPEFAS